MANKNQGKIKPFDSEASHAAIVAKGDAWIVTGKHVKIPPFEDMLGMETKVDLEMEGMVGDEEV